MDIRRPIIFILLHAGVNLPRLLSGSYAIDCVNPYLWNWRSLLQNRDNQSDAPCIINSSLRSFEKSYISFSGCNCNVLSAMISHLRTFPESSFRMPSCCLCPSPPPLPAERFTGSGTITNNNAAVYKRHVIRHWRK